eukprot:g15402.t1
MLSGAEAAGTLTYSSNPHEIGQPVRIGQTVSTRHDSFAKITLQNRVSVSLGPSTRVVVHDAALLSLTQGRIYVDAGHGQIRLLTPHVQVVDIGTIYQVVSNDAQTTVTMREGEVQLVFDRNHHRLAARDGYGDFVAISAAGEIVEDGRLSTTDTSWSWQQAARAPLKLDRLPVLDYVQWLARDSGISLRFASNAVRGDENAITFEGRRVIDVLQDYQTRGFAFLYSSGVVRASLRFSQEPPGFNPVRRLRHALNSMDLALEHVSEREYRIVRAIVLPSNEADITGRVTDAESGKPIAGARVVIGDLAAVTDQRGEFRLIAPTQNTQALHFTHPDYEAQHLTHGPEQRSFEVAMAPAIGLEELVVVSSRYAIHDRRTYAQSIDLELLESVPRLGEDPIRIANHLPGMATIGVSAKPHIRGGAQDELLVMFNNLELLEPFHLRDFKSVFSTFNPNVIQYQ